MSKYWSELTKSLKPYVPGEQPKDKRYIKLNTNENPYPPSPKVLEVIRQTANESLKLYPDPNCEELRQTIADYYDLEKEQIFVGNGSDEVLAFLFMAFFDPKKPILFPDITYSFYPVYCKIFKIDYQLVPLNEDFSLPVEKFFDSKGGVIFPNPNAPTGNSISLEKVEQILKKNIDQVVVVDEAYIDFGGESAVKLVNKYPNLLVTQTLSKSRSLAGLRVGFAIGQEPLIEGLDRIKNSFNSYTLDRLAMAGAIGAIKDNDYFHETRLRVINTREHVTAELRELGFKVVDSKANFIFISHPKFLAEDLFFRLKTEGVLVRYFKQPRIDNFLRVTIGTDDDMNSFVQILKTLIR